MRDNGTVSGREIELRDGQVIISRADRHGRIVDVNTDFIEISGYSREELIGQQHNILRHPDMPAEVFADLWDDLYAERPWIGVIQNRCKNGDAYWIEAHVAPIWEHGEVCGYMSMRWKPTDAQIAEAKKTYAEIRSGGQGVVVFRHGANAPAGPWASLRHAFAEAPIQFKLILSSLLAALLILGICSWLLADNLSRTLGDEARERVRHDVGLVRAAVASTIESARGDAIDHANLLAHRIEQALGGSHKATPAAIEALTGQPRPKLGNPIETFLTDLRGAATIFVRTPAGLKRVMTTAHVENGESAVGTLLAADHPALRELLAGRSYVGPARVFGHEYMTNYTPILDAKGRVVGATVIGIDLGEKLAGLKSQLRAMKIGSSGYYYIVNATPGPEFGRLILHPYKEDQKIDTLLDLGGRSLVAEMGARSSGEIAYFWKNIEAGETVDQKKLVIFETIKTPHWVVAGGSTIDELTAFSRRVVWLMLAGGLAMATAIFIVILVLVRNFVIRPLRQQVLPTIQKMSAGNFESHLDVRGNDEIGKLVQGLECMQTRLAFESERERNLAMMREDARQEAESLSRTRADFLANMSHEIRTPLNAVIGLAYLLTQSKLSPREQEYVRRIEGAGKLLLAVVNDVLDFSKIDAGQMPIEDAPFRLDDVLDNLSNLVRTRVQEKNLILEYVVSPDVPPALRGDALRLSQVLINLVSNAIKFTAAGSVTVFVNAKLPEEGRVELEFGVQDTGIGMTSEQLANLFQAFSQGDSSVTRKFGGTGLGLVICKRLIELMGGDIRVESRPQAGSTFAFHVVLGVENSPPAFPALPGYRVLVVDDNDLARSVLERLLAKNGCLVRTVDSGEAALAALRDSAGAPFDCIMVDLNMPGMDGLALAQHIRSGQNQATKLIMVTAENIHTARFRHALDDFDDVMEKPVTAARISEVLANLQHRATVKSAEPAKSAPLAGVRLLVAEDVPTNQLIMRDLLESLGATVEVADNGALALQLLENHRDEIDLILMDIQMPEMDGLQAARRIRAGQVRADIPIIALTAHAFEEERQRALAAGMNDFLTKPIEPPQLIAIIQRYRPARPAADEAAGAPVPTTPTAAATGIPDIPGIDVADGLRRMLNRQALYEKVLRDFHARFVGEAGRIRQALAVGDSDAAARQAHSLKGTGGMVGAKGVAEQAALLEQAIKTGSPEANERLAQFESELNQVLDGIKAALGQN
jgi:PAS domain S-box-containing protein